MSLCLHLKICSFFRVFLNRSFSLFLSLVVIIFMQEYKIKLKLKADHGSDTGLFEIIHQCRKRLSFAMSSPPDMILGCYTPFISLQHQSLFSITVFQFSYKTDYSIQADPVYAGSFRSDTKICPTYQLNLDARLFLSVVVRHLTLNITIPKIKYPI